MKTITAVRSNGRKRVVQECEGASKTEQSHRDEVNINKIVLRYAKTGQLPARSDAAMYGDFSGIGSYHEAVDRVRAAEAEFMRLPSAVRAKFRNDPGALIGFLADPANRPEAEKLGILKAQPAGPVEPVEEAGSGAPERPSEA